MHNYFGIGIFHAKKEVNIGTLFRTAQAYGASFIYTIGRRYKDQSSDTNKSSKSIPLYHYKTVDDLLANLPVGCKLVGVEIDPKAVSLINFNHPNKACYLLGAEDHGLNEDARKMCHEIVCVPGASSCLNVAVSGSIVIYDRSIKIA